MTINLDFKIDESLVPPPYQIEPIQGGRNNRAFKIKADNRCLFLKSYFKHPGDTRDRQKHEIEFSKIAWREGCGNVAKPLFHDTEQGYSVYEFLSGSSIKLRQINDDLVQQAAEFVAMVNRRFSGSLQNFLRASEACFSLAEHLKCVDKRVERLSSIRGLEPQNNIDQFLSYKFLPLWNQTRGQFCTSVLERGLNNDATLDSGDIILSPSDFGFHNCLVSSTGRLSFFDFEYAGVDDPAKLVADFFCQPQLPVSFEFLKTFLAPILSLVKNKEFFVQRLELIFSLYKIKWICIQLNDVAQVGKERRKFAQAHAETDQVIARVENYLLNHREQDFSEKIAEIASGL